MDSETNFVQFNYLQILLYHLLPGLPILIISVIFSSPKWGFGLPIDISLMLAIAFGLIPTQWMIMFLEAKKNSIKIREVIHFTEKTKIATVIFLALPCIIFALFVFIVLAPKEHAIWAIFNWVPNWFRLDRFNPAEQQKGVRILSLVLTFIFNGLLGPITEEIYSRGFLLPRMEKLGVAAPLINVTLFSLYHLFSPWENISRILGLTPFVYTVWFKKNIRIGVVVHCTMNLLSCVATLFSLINF